MNSASQRNILYLVHRVPYPPNRGDRIRSYHLLRFLSSRARVWLGCLADEPVAPQTTSALRQWCEQLAVVPLRPRRRWGHAVQSLACGGPATDGLFWSPELANRIQRWTCSNRFDAVVAFCSSMVQYFDVPLLKSVPKVVDLVDVDSQKWLDYAAEARAPRRWLYRLEAARLRQVEKTLPSQSAAILLTTKPEASLYRSFCPNDKTFAVPNGVDLEYFRPHADHAASQCRLAFVGALDYRANVEGMLWFCREVWPQVRAALPAARLALVGREPAAAIERLADVPGVTVAANVPDVRPYLAEATISIAPLQVARGVQNKILESLAMAKCVVASPQAIDGLDLEPGKHLCRAATPEQWLAEICRLSASPEQRHAIGHAGLAYVQQHHRWNACLQPLERILGLGELDHPHTELEPRCLTETR